MLRAWSVLPDAGPGLVVAVAQCGRVRLRAGDDREAAAIDRWQRGGGAWEWELRSRPWSRSAWEVDPSPWHEALAALDG